MAFCASCGRELAEDARFCDGCGAQQGVQQPPVAAPQPEPKRGKGPFVAIIAVVLAAILSAGAWWYMTQRPMSEAEYKKAAEEILTDFGKAMAGFNEMDGDDFEAGKKAFDESTDQMNDALRRAEGLKPPKAFEDANDDLVAGLEGFSEFMGRANDILKKASDSDEADTLIEQEFSESDFIEFYVGGLTKLASAIQVLDLDAFAVLGEELGGSLVEAGLDSGTYDESDFEDAKASAEEASCFANQRTLEGAAQVYLADDPSRSISDLDGTDWEYTLVPDFIKEALYCPTDYDSYHLHDGEVEPCPVHGHF